MTAGRPRYNGCPPAVQVTAAGAEENESTRVVMQTVSQLIFSAHEDAIVTTAPCRADLAGGTLDIWPLYLFHPGAVSVNLALSILTACRITPRVGRSILLKSHDTAREEAFASLDALLAAKSYRHPLAAYLVRFFRPKSGFLLETFSESPAGAGISGSSALMIATSAALARFTSRKLKIEQIRVIAQNVEALCISMQAESVARPSRFPLLKWTNALWCSTPERHGNPASTTGKSSSNT